MLKIRGCLRLFSIFNSWIFDKYFKLSREKANMQMSIYMYILQCCQARNEENPQKENLQKIFGGHAHF